MNQFDASFVYKTVVEQGSFIAAAEVLQISPSSVSKQIAYLEKHLNVQLLKRTTRRLQQTESGRLFYLKFRQINAQWESTKHEIQLSNQTPNGKLSIAAPQPVCNRLLAPILHRLQAKYPNLEIQLRAEHYEKLPLDEVDISICQEINGFNSATHTAKKLINYHNQLYASPAYLKRHGHPTNLQGLEQHQCLFYGLHGAPVAWHFSHRGDYLSASALITNTTETIIAWAIDAAGIAYLPPMIIKSELRRGLLHPVMEDYRSRKISTYAYYQKLDFPSINNSAAINFIMSELNKLQH